MTQQYTVFHRLEMSHTSSLPSLPSHTVRRSDFQNVAMVITSSPEEVFRLTNHLDHPWWEHPAVTLTRPERFRSTSAGDVIADQEGTLWLIQGVGFAQVTWEPEPAPVIEFTVRLRVDNQAKSEAKTERSALEQGLNDVSILTTMW